MVSLTLSQLCDIPGKMSLLDRIVHIFFNIPINICLFQSSAAAISNGLSTHSGEDTGALSGVFTYFRLTKT